MTNKIANLLTLLIIFGTPLWAFDDFTLSPLLFNYRYSAETRLKKDNSLFSQSETRFQKIRDNGTNFLVQSSASTGTIEGKTFTSQLTTYYLQDGDKLSTYSIQGETRSGGQPWTDYLLSYDWENMSARVIYHDLQKKSSVNKFVSLKKGPLAVTELELYLTTLPTRQIDQERIELLLPNGQTIGMFLKLAAVPETITTKSQARKCYRVEVKPDLGLISQLIPNVNYWLSLEPPYELVRYSGLLGGPGSPDIIQDIVLSDK